MRRFLRSTSHQRKAIISPPSKIEKQNAAESPADLQNRNIENKLSGRPADKYQNSGHTPEGEALLGIAEKLGVDVNQIPLDYFNAVAGEVSEFKDVGEAV